MSIDWLFDLERELSHGSDIYACPGLGRNQWLIKKSPEELRSIAARVAEHKKFPVNIVKLALPIEAVSGEFFLVPTNIGEADHRGEPSVHWSVVETKEAAELMRDVRHGSSPFFAMQVQETFKPEPEKKEK